LDTFFIIASEWVRDASNRQKVSMHATWNMSGQPFFCTCLAKLPIPGHRLDLHDEFLFVYSIDRGKVVRGYSQWL
jgi:hypothetical protein